MGWLAWVKAALLVLSYIGGVKHGKKIEQKKGQLK